MLDRDGAAELYPLATTDRSIWKVFEDLRKRSFSPRDLFAHIEQVGGYLKGSEIGKGGGAANGAAMFRFGRSTGFLHGCLVAAGIPYQEIRPVAWQRAVGLVPRKKGESKSQWKGRIKQHAQRLFPRLTVTLSICDALLIAEACRRQKSNFAIIS